MLRCGLGGSSYGSAHWEQAAGEKGLPDGRAAGMPKRERRNKETRLVCEKPVSIGMSPEGSFSLVTLIALMGLLGGQITSLRYRAAQH